MVIPRRGRADPGNAIVKEDGNGGYHVYPEGDDSVEPSGHLPANGFYFDNLTRTPEFDEDEADAADNTADYMEVSDAQIAYHKKVLEEVKGNNRAIQVGPCYSGLGDANNIPDRT